MISRRLVVFVFLCLSFPVSSQTSEKVLTSVNVDELTWLAGCWETKDAAKDVRIVEQWMAPEGGAMLGMSRTVRAGKMTGYEFLRIVRDDVSVRYVSRPSQNTTDTDFRLLKSSANEVVFENLQHDFPQRIRYRREGDKLTARIEATSNGKTRGIDFPYRRVACN